MRRQFWLVPGLLVLMMLAACGQQAEPLDPDEAAMQAVIETYNIRPVSDIVDEELIVQSFANDGTATLPITTSVSVACTIVYGTTPEFGQLTLDQDMAGGTHSEHSPLLTGLEPETTYYFRVQGVDDDGTVYLSEVMTFTTPPLDTTPVANLASPQRGAVIIDYSSAFGGAAPGDRWGVEMAFDDNVNTEWSSDGDGDDAYVEVRLAQRAQVDSIKFHTRQMTDGSAITTEFEVVVDGEQTYGPFVLPNAENDYEFEVDFQGEVLRFNLITTTGGNTGAIDIAVYGEFLE